MWSLEWLVQQVQGRHEYGFRAVRGTLLLSHIIDMFWATPTAKGGYGFFKRRPPPQTASGRELYLLWHVQNTIEELLKLPWPRDTMHNVPIFFKPHTGEHQGEHRELVGSCPEATASPNKAATHRSHQARDGSTNTRLLEPQESPARPWDACTATGDRTRWAHVCARARDREVSWPGRGGGRM